MGKFTAEEEVAIDELKVKLEAERRLRLQLMQESMADFFFEFPAVPLSEEKTRMVLAVVSRTVYEFTGIQISDEELISILMSKGYVYEIDKTEHPPKKYWIFG